MGAALVSFDGTESTPAALVAPASRQQLVEALRLSDRSIPRGAGLSYCSASAGCGVQAVSALRLDRVLDFDSRLGLVRVEPGVRVGALVRDAARLGWQLPVVPGHPQISVGGCIGFNVHGKSQRRWGNFGRWVERLCVHHPDHGTIDCDARVEPDLFGLTLGGCGLTGFVVEAVLRLVPFEGGAVRQRRRPVADLVEAVEVMEANADEWPSLHSWHDLNRRGDRFGAGFVTLERACPADDLRERSGPGPTPPLTRRPGVPLLRGRGARLFTRASGWREWLRPREALVPLERALFPIRGRELYYRLFGRSGFREYQLLAPRSEWKRVVEELEALLSRTRTPTTLGSLKLFRGEMRQLDFCATGVCLALDVPAVPAALELFAGLDELVTSVGGCVNISKDSRLSADVVRRIFPGYEAFRSGLERYDPGRRFDSALRRRLLG